MFWKAMIVVLIVNYSVQKNWVFTPQKRIAQRKSDDGTLYQAKLKITKVSGSFHCTGSLITTKFVLTAGHCLVGATLVTVTLGTRDMQQLIPPRTVISSKNLVVHQHYKQYNDVKIAHDIALIELSRIIKFTKNIGYVKLPGRSDINNLFTGTQATLYGWGLMSHTYKLSTILKKIDIRITAEEKCGTIQYSKMCGFASDNGNGFPCPGDSGGPLVIKYADNSVKQIGICSHDLNIVFSCNQSYPIIYTRVAAYIDWIEANSDYKKFTLCHGKFKKFQ